jgi:hypothetical protein
VTDDAQDARPEMVDLGPGSFAGSLADGEIRPPGEMIFSVDAQGQITYVQEALLDEVGAVVWDLVADHAYHGYADETPYEGLSAEDTAWLREVSKEALTPLLKRVAVWVRSGRW